jgi:hypothetical protein
MADSRIERLIDRADWQRKADKEDRLLELLARDAYPRSSDKLCERCGAHDPHGMKHGHCSECRDDRER